MPAVPVIICSLLLVSCRQGDDDAARERDTGQIIRPLQQVERVVGPGRVVPAEDIISLSTPVTGRVERVHVREGGKVRSGDVLVSLDLDLESAQVSEIQNRIQMHKRQHEADGYALERTKVQLENKQKELKRIEALYASGVETSRNFDHYATEAKSLALQARQQRAALEASAYRLRELKAGLSKAETALEQRRIRAPMDGFAVEVSARPGSVISPEKPFAELIPDTTLMVACELDELFAAHVHEGQPASIRILGSTTTLATGRVTYTAPHLRVKSMFVERPGDRQDRRVREIRIELDGHGNDDGHKNLIVNSRVECVVDTGHIPDEQIVTRR
jgi:multidrug efflux pump subunit AcrA (membrane-fusion protein)